tara:strand:+ start:185 stop:865 length:681 start_codon:yes stop_codon:yes gene_type:complete
MEALVTPHRLIVYLDIKSPYAFLAKDPAYQLEEEFNIEIDWRLLTLDIPSYLGSAKTNTRGEVVESKRSPQQWLAVRYAYMDAKRYARLNDIILYGTQKIWDSSFAGIAMLWAKQHGRKELRSYLDIVYERFWRRDLDIENAEVMASVLLEAGVNTDGFVDYLYGQGRRIHDELQGKLHPAGIFGVPTFVIDDEIYFGREHLPSIRWHLSGCKGRAPDVAYQHFGD